MEGYLNKVGEKGLLHLKRRRWFVLDPSLQRLRYCKDRGQPELGFINLVEAERIDEAYKTNPRDLGGFNVRQLIFHVGLSRSHYVKLLTTNQSSFVSPSRK
jgi:hypothetical protein